MRVDVDRSEDANHGKAEIKDTREMTKTESVAGTQVPGMPQFGVEGKLERWGKGPLSGKIEVVSAIQDARDAFWKEVLENPKISTIEIERWGVRAHLHVPGEDGIMANSIQSEDKPGFKVVNRRGFQITFENGWTVSVLFAGDNFCSCHGLKDEDQDPQYHYCPDAEILVRNPAGETLEFEEDHDTVAHNQSPEQLMKHLRMAQVQKA